MKIYKFISNKITALCIALVLSGILLGCGGNTENVDGAQIEINHAENKHIEVEHIDNESAEEPVIEESIATEPVEENETIQTNLQEVVTSDETQILRTPKHDTIVWIGDSLTQGSLGHDNDNLPNAPFNRLAELTGLKVEGFGFYGYNTHDVFWCYKDETQCNQSVDGNKTYIFWVGLNDWAGGEGITTDTELVIMEIDAIISRGLEDYVVIGPTARKELRQTIGEKAAYESINEDMKKHYQEHFLDILDIVTLDGFGQDGIHLNQDAYDRVAEAVYDKLLDLGYL